MTNDLKRKRGQAISEHRSTHDTPEASLLSEEPKKFDPKASMQDCIEDLRRVQEDHPDLYITRKAYRKYGQYSDSTWDSKFGTFEEFRKQSRLELTRGQHKLERDIARHASMDILRGFSETEILPWCGKYERGNEPGRWKTIIVASDFHDTDTDPFALSVFLDTVSRVQPDRVVLAGDVYDQYEFSRFDKDPRKFDIAGRLKFVRDNIFAPLREASDAQIDFLAGNHELHLMRHMSERSPEMKAILSDFMGITFADMLGLTKFEINLVCKSDLTAFKAADLREEITKNFKSYWGVFTAHHYPDPKFHFGTNWSGSHTHKPALVTSSNIPLGGIWGATVGCMSKVDNSYTDVNYNQNGFLIVHIDTQKRTAIPELVVFSDSGCIVGGKRYAR